MSEFTPPTDDGKARAHSYLAPGDDRYTLIEGGRPMTRTDAVAALRRSRPKELAAATHVELADYEGSRGPARDLGTVRVTYSLGEMLAPLLGQTIRMPRSRL
jgi:hypothetical protein